MTSKPGVLSLLRRRHIVRSVRTRNADFSVSLPRLRAPSSGPKAKRRPKKLRSQEGSSMGVLQSRKQPGSQYASAPKEALLETAARWKSSWQAQYAESRSRRLAVYCVVILLSGTTYIYFFVLDQVPITGRRRVSWVPRWELTRLEDSERDATEKIRKNEQDIFIKSDYPGLRKVEAVFNRLVKASGLDDIAWEVRVLDQPSRCFTFFLKQYSSAY